MPPAVRIRVSKNVALKQCEPYKVTPVRIIVTKNIKYILSTVHTVVPVLDTLILLQSAQLGDTVIFPGLLGRTPTSTNEGILSGC
jgi:hypothetical protein